MKQPLHDKRVLVITNMYPTQNHKSFGIFIKNQVEALRKRGLHIDVAAITNPKNGKVNVMTKYTAWVLQTIFFLLTKGKSYDLVHAHYTFPSGYLALLFKKLFGCRMVVTAHGGDIDKMARKSDRLFHLTKKVLHAADHVIAVGEELREKIVSEFSVPDDQVSVINMGVNREIFKPYGKRATRDEIGIGAEEKVILFVGNILEQKGLTELLDAYTAIREPGQRMTLRIIGAEKDLFFKKKFEETIAARNLQEDVQFLGVMEQREIARWMCAADCLVLPSHIEGFGLVALEAMACGTPVVGSETGGLKYLLADGAGVTVPVKNSRELAHSLSFVLSSKNERDVLIKNGMKKAEENDQEQMLNRVVEVYFPTGG
ncbi:glycosyltransferase [Bacillus benzoevorans]|uniref:Glycosyltransferase involved in cell wall biosynthesis n=1 Tax=Bacillus benzoevorans TaxID=1456 RepID=A0A7X0LWM7_9BACI|nr:glycosyltransferase [Bacillus benzoevorans]MBB6447251.1 glycosyltransferase involved in cell wall biosynthesis [Bacillus benzoevorans]